MSDTWDFTYMDVLDGVAHICRDCIHAFEGKCAISGQLHKIRFIGNIVQCNERNLHPREIHVTWKKPVYE